jgi:hypothetical protein
MMVAHELTFRESFPNSMQVEDWFSEYPTVDVFIVGDNHQSFYKRVGNKTFISPGSLMNRAIDQKGRTPFVYVMYDDGSFKRFANKYEQNVDFFDAIKTSQEYTEAVNFCKAFEDQEEIEKMSFRYALKAQIMREKDKRVKEILIELEGIIS